jgi:hypothetical protein
LSYYFGKKRRDPAKTTTSRRLPIASDISPRGIGVGGTLGTCILTILVWIFAEPINTATNKPLPPNPSQYRSQRVEHSALLSPAFGGNLIILGQEDRPYRPNCHALATALSFAMSKTARCICPPLYGQPPCTGRPLATRALIIGNVAGPVTICHFSPKVWDSSVRDMIPMRSGRRGEKLLAQ